MSIVFILAILWGFYAPKSHDHTILTTCSTLHNYLEQIIMQLLLWCMKLFLAYGKFNVILFLKSNKFDDLIKVPKVDVLQY